MRRHREIVPILPEEREFIENLYEEYKGYLFYITQRYTQERAEVEDIIQDVLVKLIRHASQLRTLDAPQLRGYMASAVKTTYLDCQRRKRNTVSLDDDLLETVAGKERELEPDLFLRWEVRRLRRELSHREWLALEGKYILGYSQEELGKLLGVSSNSVRMLLCRARAKARKILYAGNVTGGGGID